MVDKSRLVCVIAEQFRLHICTVIKQILRLGSGQIVFHHSMKRQLTTVSRIIHLLQQGIDGILSLLVQIEF